MDFSLSHLLAFIATMIIDPVVPLDSSQEWVGDKGWHEEGQALVYTATSQRVAEGCKKAPASFLHAEALTQGIHEFYLDGKLIYTNGDRSFQRGSNLYNFADVPCHLLTDGRVVKWVAISLTHSYAKLREFPQIVASKPADALFNVGLHAISAGSLIILGLLTFTMFWGRLNNAITMSLLGSSIFTGLFFLLSIPSVFSIQIPTLNLHRLHDSALWIGTIFTWILFRILCNVPQKLQILHGVGVGIALICIGASQDLDQSQVGSIFAFLANLSCLITCVVIQTWQLLKDEVTRIRVFQFLSVLIFCVAGVNDILKDMNFIDSTPLFSVGATFSFFLVALTANEKIAETYRERDHLRDNLEAEVAEKTKSLREKSASLETAIKDLKQAQAEVMQSSKLAALGTLSAGLAHEINNSLNYPTGALPSLKRLFQKEVISADDRKRASDILNLMGDGLALTNDIIKNLKRYSSGKIGELEDINLKQIIEGVLLLLRNQLREDIKLHIATDAELAVRCSRVGLSQILMNIIGNAVDALKEQKSEISREIFIESKDLGGEVLLSIRDTGPGIPESIISRVLEPFFTTKPQGKGTGLGLYIVNREMNEIGGRVKINSVVGQGTTIELYFPHQQKQRAAA